jgi:hypothetical protein
MRPGALMPPEDGLWSGHRRRTAPGRETTITVNEIVIEEQGDGLVTVGFGDGGRYEAALAPPLADDPAKLELVRWYFEAHLRYPFLDKDLAERAVETLTAYGRSLFEQVFAANPGVSAEYLDAKRHGFDDSRLIITGSAAFHRIHWEALRDPTLDKPLAVLMPVVRRLGRLDTPFKPGGPSPTLNLLIVTARPDGARDIGYRTISRPLVEAVESGRLMVSIEFVRPGTWDALEAHLAAGKQRYGTGHYHVVHFDLHGAVFNHEQLAAGVDADRYHFFASGVVDAFDGEQGFLFFETAEVGKAQPVSARRIAALLEEHRIPIAIMNACQSARATGPARVGGTGDGATGDETDGDRADTGDEIEGAAGAGADTDEASLAYELARAGVPVALGMSYSFTVSAAEAMVPVVYQQLTEGTDIVDAVHQGRGELYRDKTRRAYFNETLRLEDWALPAMFWQRPIDIPLRKPTDREEAAFWERRATIEPPDTPYGFFGRDLDVQAVERMLLTPGGPNQLLIQGMAGAGKTTLLWHLAEWWQRTNLVDRVFRYSYEDRSWTAEQIVVDLAGQLLDEEEQRRFTGLSVAAQIEKMAGLLRAERHLLVLDNLESVTASPMAIPHSLDDARQRQLAALLDKLKGGRTLVLLGSRQAEEWLEPKSFEANVHRLGGLDPQAASALASAILHRVGASQYLETDELGALLKLLDRARALRPGSDRPRGLGRRRHHRPARAGIGRAGRRRPGHGHRLLPRPAPTDRPLLRGHQAPVRGARSTRRHPRLPRRGLYRDG